MEHVQGDQDGDQKRNPSHEEVPVASTEEEHRPLIGTRLLKNNLRAWLYRGAAMRTRGSSQPIATSARKFAVATRAAITTRIAVSTNGSAEFSELKK